MHGFDFSIPLFITRVRGTRIVVTPELDAKVAFMKFWQIDGRNVQQGSSSGTYSTHSNSSSSTPSTEESPYSTGDVKYNLLKYQLDIAIKQRNHAMKIAKLNARMLNTVASQVLSDDE